jgi:histidine triad (HIT) family protein
VPTLFTKIIQGELPGRFVWKDERAVAFLTINPLRPGHTLVVPRAEVDHWLDLEAELARHLTSVAQAIGKAQQQAFRPTKVGLIIAGLEVPHVHLHVFPVHALTDFDFSRADKNPAPAAQDRAAAEIRSALRALGHREVSD